MSRIKGKPGIGTKIKETIGTEIDMILQLLESQLKINNLFLAGFILNLIINIAIIIYIIIHHQQ